MHVRRTGGKSYHPVDPHTVERAAYGEIVLELVRHHFGAEAHPDGPQTKCERQISTQADIHKGIPRHERIVHKTWGGH